MLNEVQAQTATILAFPVRRRLANRLTVQDRVDAVIWETGAGQSEYNRLIIHARHEEDDPEIGDFISVYRGDSKWASWGVARRGAVVSLWRCTTGADIGEYDTVREALVAIKAGVALQALA